jgi:hypothetical protein
MFMVYFEQHNFYCGAKQLLCLWLFVRAKQLSSLWLLGSKQLLYYGYLGANNFYVYGYLGAKQLLFLLLFGSQTTYLSLL